MIVGFSTSSPIASVAILSAEGAVLFSEGRESRNAASQACLELLQVAQRELGFDLKGVQLWLADLGPGSFTGTRVGVTLAKTLAFANEADAGGASAFDLVDARGNVVLPNKKGEWFFRRVGEAPLLVTDLPDEAFLGYGAGVEPLTYPSAEKFAPILAKIERKSPFDLMPEYLVSPSISIPKQPLSKVAPH